MTSKWGLMYNFIFWGLAPNCNCPKILSYISVFFFRIHDKYNARNVRRNFEQIQRITGMNLENRSNKLDTDNGTNKDKNIWGSCWGNVFPPNIIIFEVTITLYCKQSEPYWIFYLPKLSTAIQFILIWGLNLWRRWRFKLWSSGLCNRVVLEVISVVSQEPAPSIFREENALKMEAAVLPLYNFIPVTVFVWNISYYWWWNQTSDSILPITLIY
jgi:hypothetical protein